MKGCILPSKKQRRKQQQREAEKNKRDNLCLKALKKFVSRNNKQAQLYYDLHHYPLVVAHGSAGTGKSYIGVNVALEKLCKGSIKKIYLTRSPIPTGKTLGFFPGSPDEKLRVWLNPVITHIRKQIGPELSHHLFETKKIELVPLEILKGMDFTKSFVILEEAEECTMEALKMISTRIGKRSTLFMNGDYDQLNASMKGRNDFKRFVDAIKLENEYVEEQLDECVELDKWEKLIIPICEFEDCDCQRSDLTRKMLSIFNTSEI